MLLSDKDILTQTLMTVSRPDCKVFKRLYREHELKFSSDFIFESQSYINSSLQPATIVDQPNVVGRVKVIILNIITVPCFINGDIISEISSFHSHDCHVNLVKMKT